jgi:hypothetical protein
MKIKPRSVASRYAERVVISPLFVACNIGTRNIATPNEKNSIYSASKKI